MGSLRRFNLSRIIKEYNIKYFFETGTWKGDGVAVALKSNFEGIISTEIIPSIAESARERFRNESLVEIITGNSVDILEKKISSLNGNCLFWLDAHFPGAEERLNQYNDFEEEDVKLPLKKEIELIRRLRKNYDDVILIDDLRIYEDGPYLSGNMPGDILPPSIRNIDFVYKEYKNTHIILKSFREEGYLLVFPKHTYLKHRREGLSRLLLNLSNKIKKYIY